MVEKHTDSEFNFQEHLFGGVSCKCRSTLLLSANVGKCSIDAHNTPLTEETLAAAKSADAIILGAVGGPVHQTSHYYYLYSPINIS